MVTLNDNTVLAIGGQDGSSFQYIPGGVVAVFASCEIFNPATGNWTATGSMFLPRFLHRATLLPSGRVLVAGGITFAAGSTTFITQTAEVYDPVTGKWSLVASMPFAKTNMEMLTLPSGLAFVGGGVNQAFSAQITEFTDTAFYNENTNIWAPGTQLLYPNSLDVWGPTGVLLRR